MPLSKLPQVNRFETQAATASSPARSAARVAPSDAADLAVYAKALRVFNPAAAAAVLRVTFVGEADDMATTDLDVPPGLTIEPSSVRRVWASGTTAGLVIHAYTS